MSGLGQALPNDAGLVFLSSQGLAFRAMTVAIKVCMKLGLVVSEENTEIVHVSLREAAREARDQRTRTRHAQTHECVYLGASIAERPILTS